MWDGDYSGHNSVICLQLANWLGFLFCIYSVLIILHFTAIEHSSPEVKMPFIFTIERLSFSANVLKTFSRELP